MAYLDGVLYIPFQFGNLCGHFDSTPCEDCTLCWFCVHLEADVGWHLD